MVAHIFSMYIIARLFDVVSRLSVQWHGSRAILLARMDPAAEVFADPLPCPSDRARGLWPFVDEVADALDVAMPRGLEILSRRLGAWYRYASGGAVPLLPHEMRRCEMNMR